MNESKGRKTNAANAPGRFCARPLYLVQRVTYSNLCASVKASILPSHGETDSLGFSTILRADPESMCCFRRRGVDEEGVEDERRTPKTNISSSWESNQGPCTGSWSVGWEISSKSPHRPPKSSDGDMLLL